MDLLTIFINFNSTGALKSMLLHEGVPGEKISLKRN